MFNVADYFKKFTKLEGESLEQKDVILSALYEHCKIDGARFKLEKGILYIEGSPMMKSAIFTKKLAIIESLKKSTPQSRITDIR